MLEVAPDGRALAYARDDLYEKAAAVYKQALRIAPEDPVLHTDLGDAYFRLGRLKDAVRVFHKAQKIYKRDDNVRAQRDILERMVRIDPEDVGLRIQLAERYEKDRDRDQALDLFRGAAHQLKSEGRLDEFVQVLERMIYLEPERLELRKEVVRIYLGRGDEKHALKHLQYCFKVAPQDIETLELLASTFHRLGATEKALLVYLELAAMYERFDETERAAGAYRTVLTIDHTNMIARRFLGHGQEPTKRVSALPPQAQAPAPAPPVEDEDALDGIEFLDEDDDDFEEIVDVNRTREASLGAVTEVSEASLELVEIDPVPVEELEIAEVNEQVLQFLTESDVFLKYGLLDRAEDVITKVLQIEPNNLDGREQMRKLLERMGDKRGAAHQLVEMARITSRNPEVAQGFLSQARTLVDDNVVNVLAEGAGLDPKLYESSVSVEFITDVSEGLEEISAMNVDDVEDTGSYEIDLDDDFEEIEDIAGMSVFEGASEPAVGDFSIDDFVDDIGDFGSDVEDIGDDFALDGADLVDVNVNVDFDERELAVLNAPQENPGIEFNISAEDADAMFDELFGGGMLADSSSIEDDSDMVIPSAVFDRQEASENNHFGSRSLSQKFRGPVTDAAIHVTDVDLDSVNNSSLELGKTYKDMGLFSEAIDEFRAALEDPDAAPAALYNMALCHIELGQTEVAQDRLTMLSQDQSFPQRWRVIANDKLAEIR